MISKLIFLAGIAGIQRRRSSAGEHRELDGERLQRLVRGFPGRGPERSPSQIWQRHHSKHGQFVNVAFVTAIIPKLKVFNSIFVGICRGWHIPIKKRLLLELYC